MEINSNQPTTESHAGKFVMITDENFGLLKVGDLYSEHVFEMLLNYIFHDICDSRDVFRAKQRFIGLTELLQADPAFVETSPELFQKYLNLIIVLKLTALPLLDTQEVRKFFLETLLTSMQTAEVSVKEMTGSYLLWEGSAKNNISAVVDSVAENKELIGNTSLKIIGEDHDFSPIVKNWILDYNKSTAEVSKRGAMERITYFNQNVNVKQLAKEDKDLLLKVLEFYDWLRFGKQEIGAEMETAYVPRSSAERPRETAWPVDRQGSGGQATGVELDKRIGVVPGTPLKNQNMEYGMENRGETPSPLPNPPHQGEGIKGGNLPPTPPSRLEQRISELASGPASKNREYGIENRGKTGISSPPPLPNPPHRGEGNIARTLPPPPAPPGQNREYGMENRGKTGESKKDETIVTPASRYSSSSGGFSVNDALARAGEEERKGLTGSLPKGK